MSDNYLRIIPKDPHWVPEASRLEAIREYVSDQFPHAEDVELVSDEGVQFRDCGSNLELITCPTCGTEIPIERWQSMLDDDYNDVSKEFLLEGFLLPCCKSRVTLNELKYTFDQGFSRFEVNVVNPGVKSLSIGDVRELAEVIGTDIKVVFQHL